MLRSNSIFLRISGVGHFYFFYPIELCYIPQIYAFFIMNDGEVLKRVASSSIPVFIPQTYSALTVCLEVCLERET